jgi:hypothetical protein
MKANELRIGNWIMAFPISFPQQVVDVMCDSVNTENGQGMHYGEIDPIPLTEEWLLKFGFIKYIDEDKFIHKSLRYSDQFKLRDDGVLVFVSSEVYITDCKYIHQLQNLYFALTGEELTLGGNNDSQQIED